MSIISNIHNKFKSVSTTYFQKKAEKLAKKIDGFSANLDENKRKLVESFTNLKNNHIKNPTTTDVLDRLTNSHKQLKSKFESALAETSKLSTELESETSALNEAKDDVSQKKTEIQKLTDKKEPLDLRKDEIKKQISELDQKIKDLDYFDAEDNNFETNSDTTQDIEEMFNSTSSNELKSEKKSLKKSLEEISNSIQEIEKDIKYEKHALDAKQIFLKRAQSSFDSVNEKLNRAKQKSYSLELQLQAKEIELNTTKQLKNENDLGIELLHKDIDTERCKAQKSFLKKQLNNVETEIKKLKDVIRKLESKEKRISKKSAHKLIKKSKQKEDDVVKQTDLSKKIPKRETNKNSLNTFKKALDDFQKFESSLKEDLVKVQEALELNQNFKNSDSVSKNNDQANPDMNHEKPGRRHSVHF
ncbi:MAG: hypothetical protein HamCj_13410 [Candidatus Hamiltonella defensa (Ceratovacuna japonica)]